MAVRSGGLVNEKGRFMDGTPQGQFTSIEVTESVVTEAIVLVAAGFGASAAAAMCRLTDENFPHHPHETSAGLLPIPVPLLPRHRGDNPQGAGLRPRTCIANTPIRGEDCCCQRLAFHSVASMAVSLWKILLQVANVGWRSIGGDVGYRPALRGGVRWEVTF